MEIKREISYTRNTKCQDVYTESQADYLLPDYQGDVRKILFTEATLRPSGRFAGGDEVEFSGIVVYNVIYLDGEGRLSSLEFTSDYDYSVKCSAERYKDSVSETSISNYSIRLMGPRKISAKASLVGCVRLSESDVLSITGDAFAEDSSPEVNTRLVKLRESSCSAVCEREYAEQMTSLDGVTQDEVSVIYSATENKVDSVALEEDGIHLKGKMKICCLVRVGEEPAYLVEKQLPIDEVIPSVEGMTGAKLVPELTVSSLRTVVNVNETGCELVASVILEMCVLAESNETVELTLDSYLKNCPTDNSYEDFRYQTLLDVAKSSATVEHTLDATSLELGEITELLFLNAIPKIEKSELISSGVEISGEMRYSGIATAKVDGDDTYVGLKFSSPFSINVKCDCQNDEKTQMSAKLSVTSACANVEQGRLQVSANIDSSVTLYREECEKILVRSMRREGEAYERSCGVITVYYPVEGDTLFSVAKRFHTSSLKIARDNDISDCVFAAENENGSLKGINKILIY